MKATADTPTIKSRLDKIRGSLTAAAGLTYAAHQAGDLCLPDSTIKAECLAEQAYKQLADALDELYFISVLGDGQSTLLDAPAPGLD